MTASLPTSDLRLALISWQTELLSLAIKFPENFTASIVEKRLAAIEDALLAIDGSITTTLSANP